MDNETSWIVLHCSPKEDLATWIGQNKPSYNLILQWLVDLVAGVKTLHSRGIVHRDLKPSNLFLDDKLRLHLGDFDIATEKTRGYSAPEVKSASYNEKVDIWSIGSVILDLITQTTADERLTMTVKQKCRVLDGLSISFQRLARLVSWCHVQDASKRPSADLLLNVLSLLAKQ